MPPPLLPIPIPSQSRRSSRIQNLCRAPLSKRRRALRRPQRATYPSLRHPPPTLRPHQPLRRRLLQLLNPPLQAVPALSVDRRGRRGAGVANLSSPSPNSPGGARRLRVPRRRRLRRSERRQSLKLERRKRRPRRGGRGEEEAEEMGGYTAGGEGVGIWGRVRGSLPFRVGRFREE